MSETQRRRSLTKHALVRGMALPVSLLLALELYVWRFAAQSDALARPSAAAQAWRTSLGDGSLVRATVFTLGSALGGWLIALFAGVVLGLALGLSERAARAARPTIEVLRTFPPVALIPLAMLVFGFGVRMEVFVVAFACFWPIVILTQSAVRQVEPTLLEVAVVLRLSPWARARKIVLPAIVPRLAVASRLTIGVALVVAVTVEVSANPSGMGFSLLSAQQSLDPALMLAWLLWIGLLGYTINLMAVRVQAWATARSGH